MATAIDLVSKSKQTLNSGYAKSHFDFTKIVGAFLAPIDWVLDLSQSSLSTYLASAAAAADINDRIFALPMITGWTDQSSEDKKSTFGYGGEFYSGYGAVQGMFEFGDAKKALQKVLTQYNKKHNQFKLFLIDENGFILCTKKPNATNPSGFSLSSLWTPKWKFSGSEATKCEMHVSFANAAEMNADLHIVQCDFDVLGAMPTVTEVNLSVATALASRVVDIYVTTGDGEESLLDDYGTILADTSAWTGTAAATGAALTVSSAALVTINDQRAIRITYATTNYPSSGAKIIVKGAAMSVWSGLNVVGFENTISLILTV